MTCHEVQTNLSVYLYGELDFAQEEELEEHLAECAFCRQALAREKAWHSALKAQQEDVPLELLANCREELKSVVAAEGKNFRERSRESLAERLRRWSEVLGFSKTAWSVRLAAASLLLMLGFGAGRYVDRNGFPGAIGFTGATTAALLPSSVSHIRDIQPIDKNQVRITYEQVRQQELTGAPESQAIRNLLLAAMQDPADPGIRVDSVELLKGQGGEDVRDALLRTARTDPNAAVRLKALDSLRLFSSDPSTRETLKFVLEHDQNPGVRSEAIDVLVPAEHDFLMSPELADTIQEVFRAQSKDDYVHMRCLQILQQVNAPVDIY